MLKRFLVPEADQVMVREEVVRAATEEIFRKMDVSAEDAAQMADVLMTSDLRGCESHGVSNMLRAYIQYYKSGLSNPRPEVKVLRESPISATLDADRGLGIQVGPAAMQMAIDKAETTGMGAVAVQRTGHAGMIAYYPLMAVKNDMIGIAMHSIGGRLQVPTFGSEAVFGTHPIAWGAPAGKMPPFVFDVATTQVAANKLMLTRRIGSHLEPGWITDLKGEPVMEQVTSPDYGGFLMLPFGGTRENGSHKGYGFATIVDIMGGILSGNGPGHVTENPNGLFVMAIKIDAFRDVADFKSDMDVLLERLSSMKPTEDHDRVYYAGLMEHEETEKRTRDGIPYHREVVEWFNKAAQELELSYSLP
jgi:L-2-hydroxycarboxylate dehydrogenase (NAD+)